MEGIEFVKDQNGDTIKAIIDLRLHQALFEEIFERYQTTKLNSNNTNSLNPQAQDLANQVITAARTFLGTKHKLGGNTKSGIDCSGLTQQAFAKAGVRLPRTSRDQATVGENISIDEVTRGDLVFFATGSNPNRISHVGIITKIGDDREDLEFIHASTSRGVVEEQLFRFDYWKKAYRHAQRVLILSA